KTGTATDMPDITQTAWGDCLWATAQLNGGTRHGYNTADHSADELWQLLRSNCLSYRTFNPMTAWTYSTGDAAPDHVDYASASVLDATISMYDVSWWRPITLKDNDGVFAMEIGAFKKYFAGFGTAH